MEITKTNVKGSKDGEIEVEVEVKNAQAGKPSRIIVIVFNGAENLI
ncbi:hypothetical protein KKF70_06090 [bacterium]|nr:hypothetical protein [bacterium]MBU3929906.1 hypothetical protein [bacterium]MBU4122890.1 hypothetical protein [bacterium]